MRKQNRHGGFTLIEMLLVLVIAGMILYLMIGYVQQRSLSSRIDRASIQMQQILNAGLAYYVVNGSWPPTLNCLKGLGGSNCTGTVAYLPTTIKSPWGQDYEVSAPMVSGRPVLFYVYTPITSAGITTGTASATAQTIAGKLPLSYTSSSMSLFGSPPSPSTACTASTTNCFVVSSVNIPGQNLNNAPAVNYAGLYKHGGCVPVPSCPVDSRGNTMTPQIMVVPVSVSGINDPNSNNVYPISSFTAYAVGPDTDANLSACQYGGTKVSCDPQNAVSNARYWRVCLQVMTDKGLVSQTNLGGYNSNSYPYYPWGGNVTLMAITRCAITNEPSGSGFNVFSQ